MKKLVFFLVCLFTMQVVVADNDKPVTFEQLPQAAQSFVKKHFADRNVAFSNMGHRTKRFFQWSGKMGERF